MGRRAAEGRGRGRTVSPLCPVCHRREVSRPGPCHDCERASRRVAQVKAVLKGDALETAYPMLKTRFGMAASFLLWTGEIADA